MEAWLSALNNEGEEKVRAGQGGSLNPAETHVVDTSRKDWREGTTQGDDELGFGDARWPCSSL